MQVVGTAKKQKYDETDLQYNIKKQQSVCFIEFNTFAILKVEQQ
jgi:hypothetical protein